MGLYSYYGIGASVILYQFFTTTIPGTSWYNVPTFVVSPSGSNMLYSILETVAIGPRGKRFNVRYNNDLGMRTRMGAPIHSPCH